MTNVKYIFHIANLPLVVEYKAGGGKSLTDSVVARHQKYSIWYARYSSDLGKNCCYCPYISEKLTSIMLIFLAQFH